MPAPDFAALLLADQLGDRSRGPFAVGVDPLRGDAVPRTGNQADGARPAIPQDEEGMSEQRGLELQPAQPDHPAAEMLAQPADLAESRQTAPFAVGLDPDRQVAQRVEQHRFGNRAGGIPVAETAHPLQQGEDQEEPLAGAGVPRRVAPGRAIPRPRFRQAGGAAGQVGQAVGPPQQLGRRRLDGGDVVRRETAPGRVASQGAGRMQIVRDRLGWRWW